jgi:glycosyltransferase involved in cell wall biosynthesis
VLLMAREMGPGGTERQLTELAKALDRRSFEPHVAFFREGFRSAELRDAGIACLCLGVHSFLRPRALRKAWALGKYIRWHKMHIVHTFDYPLTCFGVLVARSVGVPVVLSSQRGHRALIPRGYLQLVRITDRIVNGIVVNCEYMRRHVTNDEGISPERVYLCYNGLDVARFSPHSSTILPSEAGCGAITIGAVSLLRPEKNLGLLLRAFARLAPETPNARLILVGSGPECANLRSLARELGISDRCTFQAAEPDVSAWLRTMDIFVLPSISEALSNSLMEAMGCGCAVVASNAGGSSELITSGRTGLLFDSGDVEDLAEKLKRLVESRELRAELGGNAAQLMNSSFSIPASAQVMQDIYRSFFRSGETARESGATLMHPAGAGRN